MLFGRSLFGGALVAGLITVSGVAVCTATANAQQRVDRYGAGQGEALVTVQAVALREVFAMPSPALAQASAFGWSLGDVPLVGTGAGLALAVGQALVEFNGYGAGSASAQLSGAAFVNYLGTGTAAATATAAQVGSLHLTIHPNALVAGAETSAFPRVDYLLAGTATNTAEASGVATTDFYLSGLASGVAVGQAKTIRRVRMPFQEPAKCFATVEAEAQSYLLLVAKPAMAKAFAFGTTYHVGHGLTTGTATGTADAVRIVGVKQVGVAVATGTGAAINIAGGVADGRAYAHAFGDAAVRNDGVLHYEVFGEALANAQLTAAVTVYQPQVGLAYAYGAGQAWQTRGAKALGLATASWTAAPVTLQTGISGTPAYATAQVSAQALHIIGLRGQAAATATVTGAALVRDTKVYPQAANALAGVQAQASKRGYLQGAGTATANLGSVPLRYATAWAAFTAQASAQVSPVVWTFGAGTVLATAEFSAAALRTQVAMAVMAQSTATAVGFNQVNDLVRAPADRTFVLLADARRFEMAGEDRTFLV